MSLFGLGSCFVVGFLVLFSLAIVFLGKRKPFALFFIILYLHIVCFTLVVLWLSVFFVSSSWCRGVVCSLFCLFGLVLNDASTLVGH